MSHLPNVSPDAAFGAAEDPDDAVPAVAAAPAAAPSGPPRRGPWLEQLAEKSGIYAIVLVTIFGLANALGLF